MFNNNCTNELVNVVEACNVSALGNLVNPFISGQCSSTDLNIISRLNQEIETYCPEESKLIVKYYLSLLVESFTSNESSSLGIPDLFCFFRPLELKSLQVLLPGEFLAGFLDGFDEYLTPLLLKKWLKKNCSQIILGNFIRALTDSLIGAFVRFPAHLATRYMVIGELEEWENIHLYLTGSFLLHLMMNALLLSIYEVMSCGQIRDWKNKFETQRWRINIPIQFTKLTLNSTWLSCPFKAGIGYLMNVLGQITGLRSLYFCASKFKCLSAGDHSIELPSVESRLNRLEGLFERMNRTGAVSSNTSSFFSSLRSSWHSTQRINLFSNQPTQNPIDHIYESIPPSSDGGYMTPITH
ncbi:hypothetical protein [Rickettsiella endosymbiont of Xylota segnis]|uniref:hypothetical protein n=1 Tax=Rickettsiella endosymbiont of Xylota segnis TaxID=3066238 RepID=UPI0030CB6F1B